MPSAFTHAFVALAMGRVFARQPPPARFWILSALCAVVPDLDVIGFGFGIHYSDMLGHRGLTHSLTFALLFGGTVAALFFRDERFNRRALVIYFFLVTASHGFFDALTNGGLGVAFFAPFDNTRYFFPFRPIEVSPIGVGRFFSPEGLTVILSESVWVWFPCAVIVLLSLMWRRLRRRNDATHHSR